MSSVTRSTSPLLLAALAIWSLLPLALLLVVSLSGGWRFPDLLGASPGLECFGNGFCGSQTQENCESVEGQIYLGDGTECVGDLTCPAVCWSCLCTDGSSSSGDSANGCVAEESACSDVCQTHGGLQSFQCDLGPCVAIPNVSEWGLITMTLLVLIAGTLILTPQARKISVS